MAKYYCRECAHRLNRANTGMQYWKDLKIDHEAVKVQDDAFQTAG